MAAAGKVAYGGRKVQRDIANLSFELEDVCRCLCSLNVGQFKESIRYPQSGICFDVYRAICRGRDDVDDALYLKLKLSGNHLVVLGSFHR